MLTVHVFYWTNQTENHRCISKLVADIVSERCDIVVPCRCDSYQVLRKLYIMIRKLLFILKLHQNMLFQKTQIF